MDLYFLNPTKETKVHNIQSPRVDDQGIESLIQAKGKTAPRITPDAVEKNIVGEYYFTAGDGVLGELTGNAVVGSTDAMMDVIMLAAEGHKELDLLTFCVLVLKNGFTVTGESACASEENFDEEIGRKVARANAVNKIWPLMGYELRSSLAGKAGV